MSNALNNPSHPRNIQLNSQGRLKHFLSINGLSKELLTEILDTAEPFANLGERAVKKLPLLRGKTLVNLFFENSTRTRATFELAAKRLSADVLNLDISTSSTSKGETLMDTLQNIEAMHADMFVVRHSQSGAAHFIASQVTPKVAIINAGDGSHAHPTQAMLDMFTIRRHKGGFEGLKVALVGDILHSRVARSQIIALNTLGVAEIRLIAPKTLIPVGIEDMATQAETRVYTSMPQGLKDADVVIMLRLQKERMAGAFLPSESEFYRQFGLTQEKLALAHPEAIVMHPGPINRGVEIESAVADGNKSVILNQVSYGLATRMAILSMAMSGQVQEREQVQE